MNNVIGGPQNAFDTDFPALANRMGNSASSRPGNVIEIYQLPAVLSNC